MTDKEKHDYENAPCDCFQCANTKTNMERIISRKDYFSDEIRYLTDEILTLENTIKNRKNKINKYIKILLSIQEEIDEEIMIDTIKNSKRLQVSKGSCGAWNAGMCPFCKPIKLNDELEIASLLINYDKKIYKCINKGCYKEGTLEELIKEISK